MIVIYFLVIIYYLNTIYCLPQVYVRPQSAVLLSSSEVRLKCESNDTSVLSIAYWTYIGQRIELNPSIIEMNENELRIYQFGDTAYTQPGAYACVISTQYGLLESEPAMLSLPTLDPFKMSMNEKNVLNLTEGNNAVIPCELPNGNPKPVPIFTLDNNQIEIDSNSNRYKILSNGNLHIINVKQSDSGKYQCAAKNPLTGEMVNNSQMTILLVLNKPLNNRERQPLYTVYKPPVASKVVVGNNHSIECVIAGWPKPVVEWEKYGDVLPEKRSEVIHGILYLYNIRLDDRGTYICRASSSNGQSDIAYTSLVEVLESPKVIRRPDSLIQFNKDENVSIKCGFRGRPEPIISWLYNGAELIINGLPATGASLSLNQPKEGIYQCIGRNLYGIAQASTALVLPNNIKPEEKFEEEIPIKKSLILFGPNNATVYEGETVQLHCLTQPGSSVQWLHNNDIININLMRRYEILPSGGLRIVSAQKTDSGIYECIASKMNFDTQTAKSFVHVQGLGMNIPVSKLEIINIHQIDNTAIELYWKINETIGNYVHSIQIQYRLIHPKTLWMTSDEIYNRSINHAIIENLQQDQTYKFRLIGFDSNGKQLVISAAKRFTLEFIKQQVNIPTPQITDAWITNNGEISVRWQINNTSNSETIDGFMIYYRPSVSKMNFTTITIPNIRYPLIDTYTISSVEVNQEYEIHLATYSNHGLSPMSNSIRISVPSPSIEQRPPMNQKTSLPTLDEILENITKIQNPSHIKQSLPSPVSSHSTQKSSDILYLTIGIIAGILLILLLILIAMCLLRFVQRKKLLSHIKSVNNSEYYCDGLHKNLNPEYTTSPCLQHGVVSIDGKLIPFAYPTNQKSPKIYCHGLQHHSTTNDNGTVHLNTNPLNENLQENFYHTLTPFNPHTHYEECPIHQHHLVNYSTDTLPLKRTASTKNKKIDHFNTNQPFSRVHYYHTARQQQYKMPLINKVDQQDLNENMKHSAPPSTGSSHSSSGIGSSMESPYNHWKYLVPLTVTTTTNEINNGSSNIIQPIPLTSS